MSTFFTDRSAVGVHQKRKFFELRNQYWLTDEDGSEAGRIEQSKQSPLAWLARFGTSMDTMLPTKLDVVDATGTPFLVIDKPWFSWRVSVQEPDGRTIGSIMRRLKLGKPIYTLSGPGGEEVGEIRGEDWRSRNFQVVDRAGGEIGRVTKQWRGLLTEALTDADTYAVNFSPIATADQRALTFAGALTVDLIQKQKDSGGGFAGVFGN
jgi:uncharacterized protein YxjI